MSLTSWFLSIEDFQKSDWFTGWITAPAAHKKVRLAGRQTLFDWQLPQPA
jgi:hypothetical protein